MISIILLHALFATSIPIGKVLVGMSSPFFLSGVRMLIAGILLLGYQYFRKSEDFKLNKNHWWLYAQIMFISIYLKYILRYWGLNYLPSGKMSFLLQLAPFMVAFFSYLLFNERLTLKKWFAMCIAFVGLMPLLLAGSSTEPIRATFSFFLLPELAIIGSLVAHSLGLIAMRQLIRQHGYSAPMTNGIRMFGGGLLALMTSFAYEGFGTPVTNGPSFAFWLIAIIIISNIICHNFYASLLKKYSATFLSLTDFLGPIFVTIYGCLFLGECITWHFFFAGFFVFAGLYLFYSDELTEITKITVPQSSGVSTPRTAPAMTFKQK